MKAALRAAAVHDLGVRFEDRLEAGTASVASARGAVGAFAEGAKALSALSLKLDDDIEKEIIDLEQAKLVKTWLGRAQAVIENMGRQAENRVLLAEGQLRAWREVLDLTRKTYDLEAAQIPSQVAAPVPQPVDEMASQSEISPPPRKKSIKARRQSAEAAEA